MLRKIKDLVRPKPPTSNPFNIKDSTYEKLKEFRTHPLHETYTDFLDHYCTLLAEDMLQASDAETVLYYRAFILGVRRAGTIVDEMINAERVKDARITERRDSNRAADYRFATYGSPFFKR